MMRTVIRDIFLKLMFSIQKKLLNLHKDLPFLPEREKIRKFNELVCTVQDKENYIAHIRALKQALKHGLILKKYIG